MVTNMSPRILVVEDDDAVRDLAVEVLRIAGYNVDSAGSIGSARVKLEAQSFEALVTDLRLPDGMSTVLAREVRAGRYTTPREAPMLLMTSLLSIKERDAMNSLFSDVLEKPWRNEELRATVDRLFGINEAEAPVPIGETGCSAHEETGD